MPQVASRYVSYDITAPVIRQPAANTPQTVTSDQRRHRRGPTRRLPRRRDTDLRSPTWHRRDGVRSARRGAADYLTPKHAEQDERACDLARQDFAKRPTGQVPSVPARNTGSVTALTNQASNLPLVRCAIVLRVQEEACQVLGQEQVFSARYARQFPSPRTERVSPGHLVAITTRPDGSAVLIWRWYDAVVLGEESGLIRLWEPAHGEVAARPRRAQQQYRPGTRAYLSAGLPGADWWVAGATVARAGDADVELDEVERFYTERNLWDHLA